MTDQQKVSLRPDSYTDGGGLVDDFDGTISDIRFILTDYEGNIVDPVPVAKVVFDIDGEESTNLYSVGGKGDFAPDESGMGLIKLKSKDSLTKTSKYGMFMDSIVAAGFPLNKIDDDISVLNGLEAHWLRKAVEYKNLKKKDNDRESTVLLCTKIIKLPWDQPEEKGKGKGKAKAKGKNAKAAPADDALADDVAGIIQGIIIESDGQIAKKNLLTALFKNDDVKGRDDKKDVLKLAADDAFLGSREEWAYEDGILKME